MITPDVIRSSDGDTSVVVMEGATIQAVYE